MQHENETECELSSNPLSIPLSEFLSEKMSIEQVHQTATCSGTQQ